MTYQNRGSRNLCTDATSAFRKLLTKTGRPPSLDEVAAALEIPPETLASVFRDEAHLMEMAVESALLRLHDRCIRATTVIDGADPMAQLKALADAYIDWAIDHPGVFLALHSPTLGALRKNARVTRFEQAVIALMQRLIARAQQDGLLAGRDDPGMLAELIRSFICGALHKAMLERLPGEKPGPGDLAEMRENLRLLLQRLTA
ncbi:hypothetical protein E3U26_01855 [Paracoccus ferrooxidans]|nr:hypothetical protein E3U26_01855 [Paracoccus ferrooxidans]